MHLLISKFKVTDSWRSICFCWSAFTKEVPCNRPYQKCLPKGTGLCRRSEIWWKNPFPGLKNQHKNASQKHEQQASGALRQECTPPGGLAFLNRHCTIETHGNISINRWQPLGQCVFLGHLFGWVPNPAEDVWGTWAIRFAPKFKHTSHRSLKRTWLQRSKTFNHRIFFGGPSLDATRLCSMLTHHGQGQGCQGT